MLEFDEDTTSPRGLVINVVGVGGGGGNAINTMIDAGIEGVDFIVANTDCQVLEANQAPIKVHLGKTLTKGLGAGANPEIGKAAALEDASRMAEALAGAEMVFVTAGMGGGTGTGAAPIIAQVARDLGALTVGVVTKPFTFEGAQRKKKALSGISELAKAVDALIVIPNDRLVTLAGVKMTLKDAFAMVDNVLLNAVRGISDLVIIPGLINVDFADVRTIMTGMGRALMGTGRGKGEKRALEAAQQAISSPLLEDVSINGATGILINITGGSDLTLSEVNEAATLIEEAADPGANIIFGSVIDPHAGDEVRITVIATGFQPSQQDQPAPTHGYGQAHHGQGQSHGYGNGHARGPAPRRPNDQMALPMSAAAASAAMAPQIPPGVPMGPLPMAPAGVPAPMSGSGTASWNAGGGGHGLRAAGHPAGIRTNEMVAEPTDILEDVYGNDLPAGFGGPVQPLPLGAPGTLSGPGASTIDWNPPSERPIIRPPIGQGQGQASGRVGRSVPSAPGSRSMAPASWDELGVEESEFDKPISLRRGIPAPE
jgi:cell division protein FtsZ